MVAALGVDQRLLFTGLFFRKGGTEAAREMPGEKVLAPLSRAGRTFAAVLVAAIAAMPLFAGDYQMGLVTELLILAVFAASLHLLMGLGGMASFGHAAW